MYITILMLQPENAFIVFNDGQACLKPADFGISCAVDQGRNTYFTWGAGLLTLFFYFLFISLKDICNTIM